MGKEDLSKLKVNKSVKTFQPKRRRRWISLGAALLLLAAAAALYLNGTISPAISVEVATVTQIYPAQVLSQLSASGYVVAQRKAAVASKITGRLVELMVEEGSRVKEGQVIATLENEDTKAGRDQAEANLKLTRANLESATAQLDEASKTYERYKRLVSGGYVARSQFDSAEAAYQRAEAAVAAAKASIRAGEAALRSAEVALDYSLIRAPFEGVVLTKNADIGDIVTPLGAAANAKAAVVTLADLKSLEVEADVSETNLSLIRVGQPCEIHLDAIPEVRFEGVVHAIVPTVDRTKGTIMVKVRFLKKDPRILPEMRAKVSFLSRPVKEGEGKPRTVINPAAILSNGDRRSVFVVEGAKAVEVPITVGPALGDMFEVLGGVKAGDRVVIKPSKRLRDGFRIKILEK